MSMPTVDGFVALNGQRFLIYKFAKAGEEIPLHKHDDRIHISFVVQGRFEIFDDAGKSINVEQLSRVEYAIGRWHGVRALTDDAILMNVDQA
jgi:quercetin dioxygenase-like cupin family protein